MELHKKLQGDEKEIRTKLAEEFQQKINDISTNLEKQVLENLQKSKENEMFFLLNFFHVSITLKIKRKIERSTRKLRRQRNFLYGRN